MDTGRELLEQLTSGGWALIEQWIAEREPEALHLEFKGRGAAAPKLNDFDKENIGKAVSGFANISGGILVIGIKTLRTDGVDRADSAVPSDSLAAYAEAVNKHLLVCSDPRVPGAHAVPIEQSTGSNRGVVALYVPASDGGPHRTKSAGPESSDKYFARQGTQTIVLEHPLLAAMFGRVPPPRLELHVVRDTGFKYTFRVVNVGRGVARNVRVRLIGRGIVPQTATWPPLAIDRSFEEAGWLRLSRANRHRLPELTAVFDGVLYPDDEVRVATVHYQATPCPMVHFTARIDAEGCAPTRVSDSGPIVNGADLHQLGNDGNPACEL